MGPVPVVPMTKSSSCAMQR